MSSRENLEANFATLADPNRGRLVIVGLSEEGNWRLFTGMGGRSDGSKNRYYQELEDLNGHGNYIKTAVHDPSLQQGDPSATLYIAQRDRRGWHVASNGEQTEGISITLAVRSYDYDHDLEGFIKAQSLYKNEGEKNGYTARISVAVGVDSNFAFMGKIISRPGNPIKSGYHAYVIGTGDGNIDNLNPREGKIIYTYDGKGGTDPDYSSPRRIWLPGTLEEITDLIWNTWDPNTRAGLVGKEIERGSGRFKYSFRSIHPDRA